MTDLIPPPPTAWNAPPAYTPERGRRFTLEADFAPYLGGKEGLPNFEGVPLDWALGVAMLAYRNLHRGYIKTAPRAGTSYHSALYILTLSQGGGLTGEGFVIYGSGHRSPEGHEIMVAGSFALCKHQHVDTLPPGFDRSRGWHPSYCSKCGLDTSVDSGD